MDCAKEVGDKFHDAIQQSVERKTGTDTGMRTPRVAATPATSQLILQSNTDQVNLPGPEGASGDIASLTADNRGSSSAMMSNAPLTVLSLDNDAFKARWQQVTEAGADPSQTIKAIMKGTKKHILINKLCAKWNDLAVQGEDDAEGLKIFQTQILANAARSVNMMVCSAVQDVLKRSKDCAMTQGIMTK
eukprot:3425821-Rhodomonas_salina.1